MAITNVTLVSPNNPNYKNDLKNSIPSGNIRKAKNINIVNYSKELCRWEGIIGEMFKILIESCEERILCYQDTQRKHFLRYREIDFVHGTRNKPLLFLEFKIRECKPTIGHGVSQLKKSLNIARKMWPGVSGICVYLFAANLLRIENAINPDFCPLSELSNMLLTSDPINDEIPIIWLDATEVATWALENDLLSVDDVENFSRLRDLAYNRPADVQQQNEGIAFGCLGDRWKGQLQNILVKMDATGDELADKE